MLPNLLKLGPVTIHTYGFMIVLGFLIGTWLATLRASREGIPKSFIVDLNYYLLISGIIGSKLLFILFDPITFIKDIISIRSFSDFVYTIGGGFVFFGGLLAAIPVGYYLIRKQGYSFWKIADILTPSIVIAHAFGRMGCFSAGCCHGRPYQGVMRVVFHHPDSLAPKNIALHPTQLYEFTALMLIFFLLTFIYKYKSFDGQIFWTYVPLYSVARFIIEFFRGDERPYFFGGRLSLSQLISILLVLGSAAFVFKYMIHRRRKLIHRE